MAGSREAAGHVCHLVVREDLWYRAQHMTVKPRRPLVRVGNWTGTISGWRVVCRVRTVHRGGCTESLGYDWIHLQGRPCVIYKADCRDICLLTSLDAALNKFASHNGVLTELTEVNYSRGTRSAVELVAK